MNAWRRFWYAKIDPAPLELFRQGFAWSLLIYWLAWSRFADEWLTTAGYHPSPVVDPINSPQLPLLPAALVPVVGVVVFAALLAYIFGFARKVVVWVILAATIYALQIDPIAAFTMNRLFVIGFSILALTPEPEPAADPDARPQQIAWPTRMLQVLVVSQYFASGLCKTINGDWWGGEDVLWMQIQGIYMNDTAAWMVRELPYWIWRVLQEIALWFELLAPVLFCVRKLLPLAFLLGLGLHVVVAITMDQLIYFSLQMMCFYLLFLPPQWAARLTPRRRRD